MAEKMFTNPAYVVGVGCITVDGISYSVKTGPIPKSKLTIKDAKDLIAGGIIAEGPAKSSLVDLESAAKKRVKEQSKIISDQHDELEKLKVNLPSLEKQIKEIPGLKEKLSSAEKQMQSDALKIEKFEKELKDFPLLSEETGKIEDLEKELTKLKKDNEELRGMIK